MAFTDEAGDGSSWPATVEMAENGDGTSSYWANHARKMLNRTAYLKTHVDSAESDIDALQAAVGGGSGPAAPRAVASPMVDQAGVSGNGSAGLVIAASTGIGDQMLDLPHGFKLTNVTAWVDPVNATPPAGTKLRLEVIQYNMTTQTSTAVYGPTADAATGTGYGDPHAVSTGTLSHTIDTSQSYYYVRVLGESGSGADAVQWLGSLVTVGLP